MVDVARRAGVSRALVSLVLAGKPGASPANRAKVLAAAQELGYAPDVNARRLRAGTSRLIGVVFEGHDPFTARVLDHAHEAVAARGLDLVLTMSSPTVPLARALRTLVDQRVRGVLLISSSPVDGEAAALLEQVPSAFLGAYAPAAVSATVSSVHSDDDDAVRAVVRHLAEIGHRELAVTRVAGRRSGDVRADAARAEASRLGLALAEVPASGYDEPAGIAAGHAILSLPARPTAVVAANDVLALGVIQVLRQAGRQVPRDVSVTGFDDAGAAAGSAVAALGLTTVHQDVEAMVATALDLVGTGSPDAAMVAERVVPARLVLRSTTAPPP